MEVLEVALERIVGVAAVVRRDQIRAADVGNGCV